ncbi:MAG: InlB B-repeat-containing protein [Lachnospiraceae bacterium]|nr:InlB B-repeat-containing protein [Lachnospiraceae bacterium]
MRGRKLRNIVSIVLALVLTISSADINTAFAEPVSSTENEAVEYTAETVSVDEDVNADESYVAEDADESLATPATGTSETGTEDMVSEDETVADDAGTDQVSDNAVAEDAVSENEASEETEAFDTASENALSENTVSDDSISDNTVSGNGSSSASGLDRLPASKRIIYVESKGTEEEAIEALPDTWKATLEDGTKTEVEVTWECMDDFSDSSYTSFVFRGRIKDGEIFAIAEEDMREILIMEIYFEDQIKYYDPDTGDLVDEVKDTELPMVVSNLSPNSIMSEVAEEQGADGHSEEYKEDYGDSADDNIEVNLDYNAAKKTVLSKSAYNTFKKISAKKSNNYAYSKLTSEEKKFWNRIDSYVTDYLYYGKKPVYYSSYTTTADISYGKLSSSQAGNVYFLYYENNPQAFFLARGYSYNTWYGTMSFYFYPDADTPAERKKRANTIASNLNAVSKKVNKGKNAYEKAKLAQNLLAKRVSYDWGAYYGSSSSWRNWTEGNINYCQSIISVFSGSRRQTVCAGYSKSFMSLARLAGLQACDVSGSGHEWNKVNIYGYWYCVDVTWDDDDSSAGCKYNYFLKSDSYMNSYQNKGGHYWFSWQNGRVPKSNFNYNVKNPKKKTTATTKKYNVKYVCNGGTVTYKSKKYRNLTLKYKKGSKVSLYKPVRSGYKFLGWYTNKKFTASSKVTSIKKLGKSYTLYAKWQKNKQTTKKYSVKYVCNSGTVTYKSKKYKNLTLKYAKGSKVSLYKPVRSGYKFLGWYTNKKFTAGSRVTSIKKLGKNYTLYARWQKK